jgi:hypothetical protein
VGNNIKVDVKETREWIHLADDSVRWRTLVNTVMKVPKFYRPAEQLSASWSWLVSRAHNFFGAVLLLNAFKIT